LFFVSPERSTIMWTTTFKWLPALVFTAAFAVPSLAADGPMPATKLPDTPTVNPQAPFPTFSFSDYFLPAARAMAGMAVDASRPSPKVLVLDERASRQLTVVGEGPAPANLESKHGIGAAPGKAAPLAPPPGAVKLIEVNWGDATPTPVVRIPAIRNAARGNGAATRRP
jgi:hypothetical protein